MSNLKGHDSAFGVAAGSAFSLSKTQKAALSKAMQADQQQFFTNALTPDRGYAFPMDHTLRAVEMIMNSPATRAHYASQNNRSQPHAEDNA